MRKRGKDVLCHSVVSYQKFEPMEDGSGVRISVVICIDLGGHMPDMVKNKVAEQNSNGAEAMVTHMRK